VWEIGEVGVFVTPPPPPKKKSILGDVWFLRTRVRKTSDRPLYITLLICVFLFCFFKFVLIFSIARVFDQFCVVPASEHWRIFVWESSLKVIACAPFFYLWYHISPVPPDISNIILSTSVFGIPGFDTLTKRKRERGDRLGGRGFALHAYH